MNQCEKALRAKDDAKASLARQKEEMSEQLASVWDACETKGIRLGPNTFKEDHLEKRDDFMPAADDEVISGGYDSFGC